MKLIYLLQRYSWFLLRDDVWYPLKDAASIELAASIFPLVCQDEYEMSDQPLVEGSALVQPGNSEDMVEVCLSGTDGNIVHKETISVDKHLLPIVEWSESPHADRWVNSVVSLDIEHANSLKLKIYLPPDDDSEGKVVRIFNESTENSTEFFAKRGEENELTVFSVEKPENHRFHISCEPETTGDVSDVRSLGYLLVDTIVTV